MEFNGESNSSVLYRNVPPPGHRSPQIVDWLMKLGIARSHDQANMVLILLTVVCMVSASWIFLDSVGAFDQFKPERVLLVPDF